MNDDVLEACEMCLLILNVWVVKSDDFIPFLKLLTRVS